MIWTMYRYIEQVCVMTCVQEEVTDSRPRNRIFRFKLTWCFYPLWFCTKISLFSTLNLIANALCWHTWQTQAAATRFIPEHWISETEGYLGKWGSGGGEGSILFRPLIGTLTTRSRDYTRLSRTDYWALSTTNCLWLRHDTKLTTTTREHLI